VYINDIIIASDFINNYFKYLEVIFTLFIFKNIVLSPKKSYFNYSNVEFFSFYINNFGLFTIKDRIEAFRKLAFPNNLKVFE
ncbi:uncharacterized protein B0T23DRAFT_308062, partial [Neurospora hispaniola]